MPCPLALFVGARDAIGEVVQFRFDQFILDVETGILSRDDQIIALRPRAFDLLRVLVEHAPAVVTRDRILDEVWGHDALTPNVLPQAIGEIRQALGDSAQSPRLIETQHRRGYRLLVPVQRVERPAAPMAPLVPGQPEAGDRLADQELRDRIRLTRSDDSAHATPRPGKRVWWSLAGVALLVISLLAAGRWWMDQSEPTASRARPVLALMLNQADPAPGWLADAGTELLAVALAGDDRIRLVRGDGRSGTSAAGDARWQIWLREVEGVDYALTGVWRHEGSQVALSYSLVRLDDGLIIHAGNASGTDLAALCDSAAQELRAHLHLLPGDKTWLASLPRDADARAAFYTGLAALAKGQAGEAVAALSTAAKQPDAGMRVQLALASAYRMDGHLGKAREAFATVLAGDHGLSVGERLRLEADAALVDHRPADAAASLRALHRLIPQDAQVALALVDAQLQSRQARAAATTLSSLQTLSGDSPQDPRWHLAQSRLAQLEHRPDDAREAAEQALALAEQFGFDQVAGRAQLELAELERAAGQLREASARLQNLLAKPTSDSLRAEALLHLGGLRRDLGDFAQGSEELASARALYAGLGDRAGELRAQIEAYMIESERGHSENALSELQALEAAVIELDDAVLAARYFNTLGVQAIRNGRIADAESWLQRTASEARRAGLPNQEAGAWNNLGMALARARRLDEAGAVWEKGLEVFRDSGDRMGQAVTLSNLASVASSQGNLPRSHELNEQALAIFRELGAGQHLARTAFNLGLAREREGELSVAEALFDESLTSYRAGAGGDPVLNVAAALARTQMAMARLPEAEATLGLVRGQRDGSGNPLARSHVHTSDGHHAVLRGDWHAARERFQAARELRETSGQADWLAYSDLDLLAVDLLEDKSPERIQVQAERLQQRLVDAGDVRGQVRALDLQARALIKRGQHDLASSRVAQAMALLASTPDAAARLELERLAILADRDDEVVRATRLRELAADAEQRGFLTLALRCGVDGGNAEPELLARIESLGLVGLSKP